MKNSDSEYACKIRKLVKRDGTRQFCGDYRPLNMQTKKDSFPMPLIDDVLSQMGSSQCVPTLALGSQQRQGLAKVRTKSEARESHLMLS